MVQIVDRRESNRDKSAPNRQRLLARLKKELLLTVPGQMTSTVTGTNPTQATVKANASRLKEPAFHYATGVGEYTSVLPFNTRYSRGDEWTIEGGQGQGKGQGSGDGDGQDEFSVNVSREEFMNYFFADLELPNLEKTGQKKVIANVIKRSGFVTDGAPNRISIVRSMTRSLARKYAFTAKPLAKIEELKALEFDLQDEEQIKLSFDRDLEIEALYKKIGKIPFLDDIDLRYRAYDTVPVFGQDAVAYFIMDISGSMGEHHKRISRTMFSLFHTFLQRQYKGIAIHFIAYHNTARVMDEKEFFSTQESGGTTAYTAIQAMQEHVLSHYDTNTTNVYAMMASDGDSGGHNDIQTTYSMLKDTLPHLQHMSYVFVDEEANPRHGSSYQPELQAIFTDLAEKGYGHKIDTVRMTSTNLAFAAFKKLYKKDKTNVKA